MNLLCKKQGLQPWESDQLPIFSDRGLVLEKIVGVSAKSALSEFGIAPEMIHIP